jgi:hypothetical protein
VLNSIPESESADIFADKTLNIQTVKCVANVMIVIQNVLYASTKHTEHDDKDHKDYLPSTGRKNILVSPGYRCEYNYPSRDWILWTLLSFKYSYQRRKMLCLFIFIPMFNMCL